MPKKTRKPQERVVTAFQPITPKMWGVICSCVWTDATRILIGALFAGNGDTKAMEACEGAWSRVMQANRMFIKYGLPFRIREYELPDAKERRIQEHYHIAGLGLHLNTIVNPSRDLRRASRRFEMMIHDGVSQDSHFRYPRT